jgi:hypothetical protein
MIKTRLIFEAAKIRPFLFSDRLLFKWHSRAVLCEVILFLFKPQV